MSSSLVVRDPPSEQLKFEEELAFLAGLTRATVEASRVRPGEKIGDYPRNSLPHTVIRPGGRQCYPAVWTQDFCMTLDSGFVTDEEARQHLMLIANGQNGRDARQLQSGACIPPFAIPDHLTFDGRPVYFPGTYSSGEDQGGEPWGIRPPSNNYYDFIAIAYHLWRRTGSIDFLSEPINGMVLWERLKLAFYVPEFDPGTGLVATAAEQRAVGFIFCDSIYMTGKLCFASLLRRRAALQLAEMDVARGESPLASECRGEAERIKGHLASSFRDPARIGGWLMAATEVGRQADVWGTIYALFLKVLSGKDEEAAREEIVEAIHRGTILYRGAVRHVPTNLDARPDSAWERTPTAHNTYQNGAYWHTPTGWLVAVLWDSHRSIAIQVIHEMVRALREEDFRRGPEFNAPWECLGHSPEISQNALFLASVTTPYGVLKNLT